MYRNFFPLFDFQRTKTQKMEIPDKKSCQPRVIEKLRGSLMNHVLGSKEIYIAFGQILTVAPNK